MRVRARRKPPPGFRDARGDQRVHDLQLRRLEPDHHVGELTIDGLTAVLDEPDVTGRPLAVVVFVHHLDVPDLGPPLQQVVPELVERGGDGQLERPCALATFGDGDADLARGRRELSDQPGHQLARLHPRRVVVSRRLDAAYPAGEISFAAIWSSCWMSSLSTWFIRLLNLSNSNYSTSG